MFPKSKYETLVKMNPCKQNLPKIIASTYYVNSFYTASYAHMQIFFYSRLTYEVMDHTVQQMYI